MKYILYVLTMDIFQIEDVVWKFEDLDPYIKHLEKRDRRSPPDREGRYNRRLKRATDRAEFVKSRSLVESFAMKPMITHYNGLLDVMASVQSKFEQANLDDFEQSICCPILYDDRNLFYNRLKLRFKNINLTPHVVQHTNILKRKMVTVMHMTGMQLANIYDGYISKESAIEMLDNMDKFYANTNLCPNCIYCIISLLIYESTPLIDIKDQLIIDTNYMKRHPTGYYVDVYEAFLTTKKNRYLHLAALLSCATASWYKDIINKMRYKSNFNKTFDELSVSINDYSRYVSLLDTSINCSVSITKKLKSGCVFKQFILEIESAYVELGKRLKDTLGVVEYNEIVKYAVQHVGSRVFDLTELHKNIIRVEMSDSEQEMGKIIHLASMKYLYSIL